LAKEKYSARYLSASLLNNFFECPRKWYFRNILQIPEPENENLVFGSMVHSAIDQTIKTGKIILPENKKAAKVVEAWVQRRLAALAPERASEQSVTAKDENFPHLSLYGKIDLIENLEGAALRVTDFKTGTPRKKSEIEKLDDEGRLSGYLRQLAMYAYLIHKSPEWHAEVRQSRLEFVEAKNPAEAFYDTAIRNEQINLLMKDVQDYDEMVKREEWMDRPCNYNSYGKNTGCEYCLLAGVTE
jgi:CRISPR/Cas system-associated exonuclease Cas4 (RecB family)